MGLVDMNGAPTGGPQPRKVTDQEILHALGTHRDQLQRLSTGTIQSGLFMEWIANQLVLKLTMIESELEKLGVKVDLRIDPEEFPAWAQARYEEVQAEERQRILAPKVSLDDK